MDATRILWYERFTHRKLLVAAQILCFGPRSAELGPWRLEEPIHSPTDIPDDTLLMDEAWPKAPKKATIMLRSKMVVVAAACNNLVAYGWICLRQDCTKQRMHTIVTESSCASHAGDDCHKRLATVACCISGDSRMLHKWRPRMDKGRIQRRPRAGRGCAGSNRELVVVRKRQSRPNNGRASRGHAGVAALATTTKSAK
ncbi:hypothetical protein BHM03_00055399 [Ensete ventricosum]|nr:hypothetical protein BHM03_00055399 [Ensete ventricosum]